MAVAKSLSTRSKLASMTLEELYTNPPGGKFTPAVVKHIKIHDKFDRISPNYCRNICTLPEADKRACSQKPPLLMSNHVDILVIQNHAYNEEKSNSFKTNEQVEAILDKVIRSLAMKSFGTLTWAKINAMKCRPSNSKITETAIRKCNPYLLQEIAKIRPKVIIALGNSVLKSLEIKDSYSGSRGEFKQGKVTLPDGEVFEVPVMVTIHPKSLTYIRQNAKGMFWGPDFYSVIERDFAKAARVAAGTLMLSFDLIGEVQRVRETYITVCDSLDSVEKEMKAIQSLPPQKMLAVDIEATSLDPYAPNAKILMVQFGYKNADGEIRSIVVPLWHRENKAYDADSAWAFVKEVLESNRPKFGHNLKFDCIYIRVTKGVRVHNVFTDTMFLIHAKNSGVQGTYGLKKALWDFCPELNLGGYEDLLPALTKKKKTAEESETETESEGSEE